MCIALHSFGHFHHYIILYFSVKTLLSYDNLDMVYRLLSPTLGQIIWREKNQSNNVS